MKTLFSTTLFIVINFYCSLAGSIYDNSFTNKTLRIDLVHSGNFKTHSYSIQSLKEESDWAGSRVNLIDNSGIGDYKYSLIDLKSSKELFSRSYCSLFYEWQSTQEAKETNKSFFETIIMPFPKNNAILIIYSRNKNTGNFDSIFSYRINASSYFISQERKCIYPVKDILNSGNPATSVDIVLLPEGYTESEMEKFAADCEKFSKELFAFAPFTQHKAQFNIKAVMAPSAESGADIPSQRIWKNTLLDCSFSTFDSERYIMTENVPKVRDIAANTSYDIIYILVNTDKYGGGAIYNYYSVSVMNNKFSKEIFLHELGHLFSGLGDEYYTSETSYNEYYNLKLEPWEANLTTLVDFESKWKSKMYKSTPIPTPRTPEYKTMLGAFEGGGYSSKGIYSPQQDCMMKSLSADGFCPVCIDAIEKMIQYYIN
ncbi:MAG: M64 family metallopeptidase [Bacteroidota bacterium]